MGKCDACGVHPGDADGFCGSCRVAQRLLTTLVRIPAELRQWGIDRSRVLASEIEEEIQKHKAANKSPEQTAESLNAQNSGGQDQDTTPRPGSAQVKKEEEATAEPIAEVKEKEAEEEVTEEKAEEKPKSPEPKSAKEKAEPSSTKRRRRSKQEKKDKKKDGSPVAKKQKARDTSLVGRKKEKKEKETKTRSPTPKESREREASSSGRKKREETEEREAKRKDQKEPRGRPASLEGRKKEKPSGGKNEGDRRSRKRSPSSKRRDSRDRSREDRRERRERQSVPGSARPREPSRSPVLRERPPSPPPGHWEESRGWYSRRSPKKWTNKGRAKVERQAQRRYWGW